MSMVPKVEVINSNDSEGSCELLLSLGVGRPSVVIFLHFNQLL